MSSQLTSKGKTCIQPSLMQPSAALSETRYSGDESLAGPVLFNSICGLRSPFSGLQSNELNDECFFLSRSHALRGTLTHGTSPETKGQGWQLALSEGGRG